MEAFAALYHRCKHEQIAALLHLPFQSLADFVARLRSHGDLAVGTELSSESSEEQPQEMINFCNRGHCALATATGRALLDADGGRNARDEIDIRRRQLFHELARVGVHRIEETSLALGEQQVKRERAFTRTAHACDHDELVARDREREVFQIMFPRAVNEDRIVRPIRVSSAFQHVHYLHHTSLSPKPEIRRKSECEFPNMKEERSGFGET